MSNLFRRGPVGAEETEAEVDVGLVILEEVEVEAVGAWM